MDADLALLLVVTATALAVVGWAGRKRFPLRIGVGNFFRRKTQVAIVVAGLLIGTAIVTSSFVIQRTFDYTIRSAVFRSLDLVDETISVRAQDDSRVPFNISVYDTLVAAMAPRIHLSGAAIGRRSSLFEPTANLIGFDAGRDLGSFVRADGSAWDGSGLAPTEAVINEKLAAAVEASLGDGLTLVFGGPRGPLNVTVAAIVKDAGRGAWNDGSDLFVPLPSMQGALGVTDQINVILVANVGGAEQGYLRSDAAVSQLESHLPPSPTFIVAKAKADSVQGATEGADRLAQVFVLLSFFTIIAGVLLIVNIFVMLAEERKGEMGVARALGMRRKNLVQSFVSEGLLYALLSSVVGMFGGLLIAGVILWGFSQVFQGGFGGGLVLTWTVSDLLTGFAIGFLITMATIGIASFRVSKLNIVRAIRDIPEPVPHRSTRRQLAIGAVLVALGALGTVVSLARQILILQDAGPSALAIGIAVLTMRITSPRRVFTAAGILMLAWLLSPWKFFSTATADITLFILVGLLLILGGLLIVLFNSESVLAVATRLFRSRTWRPVVRTAIAYPMNKKFRTGATLASIALVMFTIATMSCIQAMVSSSISTASYRESGGFQLLGSSAIPIPNWETAFTDYSHTPAGSADIGDQHGIPQARIRIAPAAHPSVQYASSLIGVPSSWTPPLSLQARAANYSDDAAAWAAIQANPDVAILDGSVVPNNFGPNFGSFSAVVGDLFRYTNATGATRNVRVIGILYEQFAQGLWVSASTVKADVRMEAASLFYFQVKDGVDVTKAGHDLERYFLPYQLLTLDIQGLINQILETTTGVFNLLQAYLALGLIVGIAGLGVITMRNVVERRQETGALRALGFRKSMVLRSFLFELSFIALTGIAMGVALGIALSYDLFLRFFEGQASFIIPWTRLALLGGIAFFGSVLATASPAFRAANMPPAEALRSFE